MFFLNQSKHEIVKLYSKGFSASNKNVLNMLLAIMYVSAMKLPKNGCTGKWESTP